MTSVYNFKSITCKTLVRIFMRLKYFIVLLLCWSNSFSQRNALVVFEETQIDSISNKIDSILLIGTGTTTTRIFLDELSQYIMKDLNDNSIVANYFYVGKTAAETKLGFDTISKKGYKAILFFLPIGESFFDVQGDLNQTRSNTAIGPITTTIATSRIAYQQDFNFLLCIPDGTMKKVWTASLQVSGDLSKSKAAKKVATKLLSNFKKNRYI